MLPLKCKIKLPLNTEPGSFGAVRRHDVHTGVDLYCEDGEPVYAIEDGVISNYGPFTGIGAESPWWEDTDFICIKGRSGKILYGEIIIDKRMLSKTNVKEGDLLGTVKRVIRVDKGRPMTMLHIELYNEKYSGSGEVWHLGEPKPYCLEDVTQILKRELQKKWNKRKLVYLAIGSGISILLLILNNYYQWI
jgi:hypothetical protein